MNLMTHKARKALFLLTLVASLVFPTGVFAASQSGNTTETLVVQSTISAIFPTSATYGEDTNGYFGAPGQYWATAESVVEILATNNATGLTISAHADNYTGAATVSVTNRAAIASGYSTGSGAPLSPTGNKSAGTFATTSTEVAIATADGPLANRQVGLNWGVAKSAFPVAGDYVSAVHYTVQTNP